MTNPKHVASGKLDNDYSLQLNRWFLKPIGAWPCIVSRTTWTIFLPLQIVISWIIVAIITVPCLLHVLFEVKDIQTRLHVIGPLLHRLIGWVNYWTLLNCSDDIRNCILHMETDWKTMRKTEDREVMLQYAKFGRFLAIVCGLIMHGGTLLFSIVKSIKTITVTIGNETFLTHPMTCPSYSKIIDTRLSPVNEIAIVMQFTSTLIVSSATVGACSLTAVFAMHACGQLNLLYSQLNKLVEDQEKENYIAERRLASIVSHHLRVLSFISRVESIIHKIALVELVGSTIAMCLVGYYIILDLNALNKAKLISDFIVYVSLAFNSFIFCYIGETLTEQCKRVGEIAYMTNWYKLHHKTALNLVLIIAQSNNVIKLTAGKLFQLSMTTFGDIIKSSVIYLNML
ncbi:ObirOr5-L25 [Ooceraea biroi]|uniref:Odorant receptor n=1 Tax=Ooceraea biroi TaxID=2015173 RepID=A0A3L8D6W3_OOCBI|nr:ObirOr5-L25 [Ooceraea biroi]